MSPENTNWLEEKKRMESGHNEVVRGLQKEISDLVDANQRAKDLANGYHTDKVAMETKYSGLLEEFSNTKRTLEDTRRDRDEKARKCEDLNDEVGDYTKKTKELGKELEDKN